MWIYLCFEIVQHEMNKILKGIINTRQCLHMGPGLMIVSEDL